ncbi:MAG: glucose 1-dehydrogenase [Alphaproteobacteria bacterium]|jgi:NAD(P)-dependent dehydrogenase (short-subunit alcohol dehydrogenase family)|nr:glucose 1-dehydrogenase [Alphaproteobacteria bacterium]
MRLENKVALLTGAAAAIDGELMGFGGASAHLFVREGAKIVMTDIRDELGERSAAALRDRGADAIYRHLDVTSETDWKQAVEDTMEAYGRLDILFNNAGVAFPSKIENLSEETWDLELAVHAKGAFLGTKTAIPAMRRGGGGSIINTSSIMGIVGSPTTPAYSAAKGAVRLFTKTAALQYAAENIRVNSIHPGYATTPLTVERFSDPAISEVLLDRTPMGRLGTAEDIANGVLFLASDESAWMTGTELVIDGGMTAQ